jgi:hypothetical protein
MKILKLALLLLSISTFTGVRADANSDALQKLAQVPNAPLVITQDQASGSPTVILTDKGALINKSTNPVPFDQVLIALAALPKDAWPWGRVVFYSGTPAVGSAPSKDVADKVELDMEKANIRLLHVPTE